LLRELSDSGPKLAVISSNSEKNISAGPDYMVEEPKEILSIIQSA
jgi:hypothetical protein